MEYGILLMYNETHNLMRKNSIERIYLLHNVNKWECICDDTQFAYSLKANIFVS
jgi:hypothetical protein